MEYRILGPVEVLADGDRIDVGGPLERALLARLLLSEGRSVSQARLVEDLWEGEPPESAPVSLRVRVSKLRKALASAGDTRALATDAHGYSFQLGEGDCLDAAAFRLLVDRGRTELKAGAAAEAAKLFHEALGLWRGAPLAGVADAPFARAAAARLDEERLAAIGDAVDARLLMGDDINLLAELEDLCARYPLHERLCGQRMLALYRSGRQADALAAFQQLRRLLRDELGIDPSPELVELERRILKQSPDLVRQAGTEALPSGVVTFVLTDIEGSTELWEVAHRAMRSALELHDQLIASAVRAHHGALIKSKGEGDATLSVFRRPSDAVAAAAELHGTLAAEPWPGGIELRVRIALHTGEAQERDGDYFGPALNRASRLRSLAAGGQVVLSRITADLARDQLPDGVALLDLGDHQLRGSAHTERVYELTTAPAGDQAGAAQPSSRRPALPDAIGLSAAGPFVGRGAALERLEALLATVQQGSALAAFISGEPGIGKTRLASELARRAYERGAVVLYGRCDEDSVFPYQPFIEALRLYATTNPAALRRELAVAADLAHLLPELGLSRPVGPAAEDAEGARYKLFDAVARVLEHAARDAPLLLVLDDLHWAERPTLLLLRHVLRACHAIPLFIVATYRESDLGRTRPFAGTLADLRREHAFERVALRGLNEDDVVHLLEQTAAHDVGRRGRALARALTETTDGNPFFMAQIVGHLIETESIKRIDGRWILQERVENLSIPEGVQEAVGRRLSRLSEPCNRALAAASVLGRTFELDALARMVETDADDLLNAVEEAIRAGLVQELAERPRPTCTFTHALVQQALYSEMSLARKQRLHLRAADALEAVYQPDIEPQVPMLAVHLRAAGAAADAVKTIDYSIRATEIAWRHLAFEDAMAHAEAALDLLDEHETPPAKRARLLETLGAICFVAASDYARGLACLEDALGIYEREGMEERAARVHLKLGRSLSFFWRVMDIARAKQHLRAAQRMIAGAGDRELEGRLAAALGTVAIYDTDVDLVAECAARAMELGRDVPAVWAAGASLQGWCLATSACVDDGLEIIDKAWHVADQVDHVATAFGATWIAAGWSAVIDAEESLRVLQRELDKPRESQASNTREGLLALIFGALVMMGRVDEARALQEDTDLEVAMLPLGLYGDEVFSLTPESGERTLRERNKRFRRSGNQIGAQGTLQALGHLLARTGRIEEARAAYDDALSSFGTLSLPVELYTRAYLAVLDIETGDLDSAKAQLRRGEEIAVRGSGLGIQLALHLVARGMLAASEGRLDDANRDFAEAVDIDGRAHHPWRQAEALHLWGRALANTTQTALAIQKFDEAFSVYAAIGAGKEWTDQVSRDRERAATRASL